MNEPHLDPQQPMNRENSPLSKSKHRFQKRWVFFGALAVLFVVAYCIANFDNFASVFAKIGAVITPLVIGVVIAYLCNPILKFYEYIVFRKLKRKGNLRLGISLLCTVLTALGILAIIIAMIVPELYESIMELVKNYQTYLNSLLSFVQSIIDKFELDVDVSDVQKLTQFLVDMFGSVEDAIAKILPTLQGFMVDTDLIGNIWSFLGELFNTFKNLILGIFIAFYILSSKEKRFAQIEKFRAAFFSEKTNGKITEVVALVDKTFGGFLKGMLLDALAVGVVTFILLSICRVSPYNLLIATICAITNIIPVFGPFIGAIPSGLIVLITNPEKFLLFIVLVIIIQQIDGNILCPMIQGNNTGVSSLAVLIAITVMGGFFDIPGMIIGVPVFAVIIELCKRAIEERLVKQNKETDTTHYYRATAIGNAEEEVYYEHAHWKYKYDHSRLKPHVDKLLAAIARIGQTDDAAPTAVSDQEPAAEVTDADTDLATVQAPVPETAEEVADTDTAPVTEDAPYDGSKE